MKPVPGNLAKEYSGGLTQGRRKSERRTQPVGDPVMRVAAKQLITTVAAQRDSNVLARKPCEGHHRKGRTVRKWFVEFLDEVRKEIEQALDFQALRIVF